MLRSVTSLTRNSSSSHDSSLPCRFLISKSTMLYMTAAGGRAAGGRWPDGDDGQGDSHDGELTVRHPTGAGASQLICEAVARGAAAETVGLQAMRWPT